MSDEERTCKTCHGFNSEALFCRPLDTSMAEWDTCSDHKTYEEFEDEFEFHGINEGFRLASEKLEAITNHVDNFQYIWMTNSDITEWYSNLQKIIQDSEGSPQ